MAFDYFVSKKNGFDHEVTAIRKTFKPRNIGQKEEKYEGVKNGRIEGLEIEIKVKNTARVILLNFEWRKLSPDTVTVTIGEK